MPHIVAQDEASAWYALGYEQARDALLWIQYACKAAKGELTWVRGADGFQNDVAVKIFNSHGRLAAMTVAQRRTLFAPTNPNIQANFYDNCAAFAAGADAYRRAVLYAPSTSPLTPERQLRNWLDQHALPFGGQSSLSWVYLHPIEAVDIAAQGAWTTALMSFPWTSAGTLVNSVGASYGILPGYGAPGGVDPEPAYDPMQPGSIEQWLDPMRQQIMALPGAPSAFAGSDTFAWSRDHCKDASPGTTSYAGLLGDPHQPLPNYAPVFELGFRIVPHHLWVAHVRVTPPGAAQPTLDVLGHVPHASASFFTCHNRSVAMGGTFGGPNYIDTFLLRLDEDPQTGAPASPNRFYSYYHDSSANPTNATWRSITAHQIVVKRWDNMNVAIDYWRADSFGVILPNSIDAAVQLLGGPAPTMPVAYGERIDPNQPAPRWRVEVPAVADPMRFWKDPQPDGGSSFLTSPMVVALRAPIDAAVAGEDMHWQLVRDFWEITHATTVMDVIGRTNGAAYLANVCFVDRAGRTFSTQLSAIPERGVDAALNAQYHTLDKWAIYNKAIPVPARHYDDRMFDWQFGSYANPAHPSQLHYLQYPTVLPPTGPFKPATFQDPVSGFAVPPVSFPATGPFRVESGSFASACNDLIWGFSRKRDAFAWSGSGFSNVTTNNQLFQWSLDAGVVYQTKALGLEGATSQQIVVDRFTRQFERIARGGSAGLPPLTPAQMRDFVVTPELYHEDSYAPPPGVTANAALPTPIRQLKEVVDNATHIKSPLVAAQTELQFFNDLWTALFSARWDQHQVVGESPPLTVSLRDLWLNVSAVSGGSVGGHQNQIFWYNDLQNPVPNWIDLPPDFPLIDFYWPESEVSRGVTAGTLAPNGLSATEFARLGSLVTQLVNWDPAGPHYRNVPTSPGACLLEMMRMGYNATTGDANHDFGRHWVRQKGGQVELTGSPNTWASLTSSGQPPLGGTLVRQAKPWDALREIALPSGQLATLFDDMPVALQDAIAALYDPVTLQVRATLRPEDTNALVRFFLTLGGHYIEPTTNQGNPSSKLARYQRLSDPQNPANNEANFLRSLPAKYPLTAGLQRLTAVRALLDTDAFLQTISPTGTPPYSQCFRTRAYDHTGQIWPAPPLVDSDCVGGSLRSVAWLEDLSLGSGNVPNRGFQPKFIGIGGSLATLLALFPSDRPQVDSYFWCTPGIEVMTSDRTRFDAHMSAFSINTLLETWYDDFLNHVAWSVVHYP